MWTKEKQHDNDYDVGNKGDDYIFNGSYDEYGNFKMGIT